MLPKRKYIRSYIGMGVAVPIYGQSQAVKLKIIGMLVSYDRQGASIEGLRLENIDMYKNMLRVNSVFMRNGLTYVNPKIVFGSKREAIDFIDEEAKSEAERKMSYYEDELKKLEDREKNVNAAIQMLQAKIQACQEKIDEAIKVKRSRKWNKSL